MTKTKTYPGEVELYLTRLDNLIEHLLCDEYGGVLVFCNNKLKTVWGKGVTFSQTDDQVRKLKGSKNAHGKGGKEIMKIDFSEEVEPQMETLKELLRKEKW